MPPRTAGKMKRPDALWSAGARGESRGNIIVLQYIRLYHSSISYYIILYHIVSYHIISYFIILGGGCSAGAERSNTHVCLYACMPVYLYACMPVYLYTCIPVHLHTYRIPIYMCTFVPIYPDLTDRCTLIYMYLKLA